MIKFKKVNKIIKNINLMFCPFAFLYSYIDCLWFLFSSLGFGLLSLSLYCKICFNAICPGINGGTKAIIGCWVVN